MYAACCGTLRHTAAVRHHAAIYRNTGFEGQVIATLSFKTAISNFCPVLHVAWFSPQHAAKTTQRAAPQRNESVMNEPRVYLHVTSGQKLLLAV